MAEIFRARYEPAPGVTKQVVIKRILPHYAENKAFIGAFTNEAKIVMGLSHGNIAQVSRLRVDRRRLVLAMELVDGHRCRAGSSARTFGMPVLRRVRGVRHRRDAGRGCTTRNNWLDDQAAPGRSHLRREPAERARVKK